MTSPRAMLGTRELHRRALEKQGGAPSGAATSWPIPFSAAEPVAVMFVYGFRYVSPAEASLSSPSEYQYLDPLTGELRARSKPVGPAWHADAAALGTPEEQQTRADEWFACQDRLAVSFYDGAAVLPSGLSDTATAYRSLLPRVVGPGLIRAYMEAAPAWWRWVGNP